MTTKSEVLEAAVGLAGEAEDIVGFKQFLSVYYSWVAEEELANRDPLDVYGAARAHWEFAGRREPGTEKIRIYNPGFEEYGWSSAHTAVEVVNDDMPFLVDSLSAELNRHGFDIYLMIHPLVTVQRDGEGRLVEVFASGSGDHNATVESFIHIEVDRQTEPGRLRELHDCLHRALREVRAAVEDWRAMSDRLHDAIADLELYAPPLDTDELKEIRSFLEWLDDHHFTFLGYRAYEHSAEGDLRPAPDSGLGLLRGNGVTAPERPSEIEDSVERIAPTRGVFGLVKSSLRSTVHRPSYLDQFSVRRFDRDGEAVGEHRFVGLYTSVAYGRPPWEIPLLRRKVAYVLDRAGYPPASHNRKALANILENYPRDELFQIDREDLLETSLGVLNLQERRRVRLFVRPDYDGRFISCLVYLPRERYDTQTRGRIEEILLDAFGGTVVEHDARLSESVLARAHFVVRIEGGGIPDYDADAIEERLIVAVRSWQDIFHNELVDQYGEERGTDLIQRYGNAFPVGYRSDFPPRTGATDVGRLEELATEHDLRASLYRSQSDLEGAFRFKLYRRGEAIPLSRLMPILENMGITVVDERPHEVLTDGSQPAWIYDFGLSRKDDRLRSEGIKELFEEAFVRIWRGEAEDDGFNRLVVEAKLGWRQVALLRAYGKYLRQTTALAFSQSYVEDALAANPPVARSLVELFEARLDPLRGGESDEAERLTLSIEADLDSVASLDEDRILRGFLSLVRATLRTSYFQKDRAGEPKEYLSFKLDSQKVPNLPLPKPMFEIFVYSPRMEGIHLRGGEVARGGIRWSDRREDFRTEVLGLMKAQTVKNAVIVPVGAKGGFVVKQPPRGDDRASLQQEAEECYRTLIRGMLDLTDNLKPDGTVIPPPDVVRFDEDDPYLVVAADKGTATFSDIANSISNDYGFWLGDAFASGGSVGYDHKAMGITAKGAWESVKRHFRELGVNEQEEDFTVVGVGDMAGDVFGNGMLLSRHIKLIGAFNHLHVFLDPYPDPEASFQERKRLFGLPRSSWTDYDENLISEGGGVFPRTAKSITLSPQARETLCVEDEHLTPNELISAMLKAKVDLLWNGGIGTYVKSPKETNPEVGDRANDGLRVDADELRCRVVGEGGNLGITQRGRVEYALRGGKVNTDAVDNSAGVDCSDHEVNIKILLDAVVEDGDMTVKQRDELLGEMADDVAGLVLRDNREQNRALANATFQAAGMADVHARHLRTLEGSGRLDRGLEFLPDEEEIEERKASGLGLTSPELSVLLAFAKLSLHDDLLESGVPEDGYLATQLEHYFPAGLRERFAGNIRGHRLRRELLATALANEVVNRCGTTFVFRLGEETGATSAEVVRAYVAARDIFGIQPIWEGLEGLVGEVAPDLHTGLFLEVRRAVERATRWLLRNRRATLDLSETVEYFSPTVEELSGDLDRFLTTSRREALDREVSRFVEGGTPERVAREVSALGATVPALDVTDVAAATGQSADATAATYFALGEGLRLDALRSKVEDLPRRDLWQTLARAALRDDLQSQRANLTAEILDAVPHEQSAATRLDRWAVANRHRLARTTRVLAEIERSEAPDIASLSVALQEIRDLVATATARNAG